MIMFATDEGLTHLARSDVWYTDGTFNSAPVPSAVCHSCAAQRFVIWAVSGHFYPKEPFQSAKELLQSIQNKWQELSFQSDSSTVITDYELAVICTIKIYHMQARINSNTIFIPKTQSSSQILLHVPVSRLKSYGDCAFSVTAPFCGIVCQQILEMYRLLKFLNLF